MDRLPPADKSKCKWYYGGKWLEHMVDSKFTMYPRGCGRSAFGLYETIQMGFLPIYVYDDYEWLPYRGSPNADWDLFGLSMKLGSLQQCVHAAAAVNKSDVVERRATLKRLINSHFTYAGVIAQIEKFLANGSHPVYGSDLRCGPEGFNI